MLGNGSLEGKGARRRGRSKILRGSLQCEWRWTTRAAPNARGAAGHTHLGEAAALADSQKVAGGRTCAQDVRHGRCVGDMGGALWAPTSRLQITLAATEERWIQWILGMRKNNGEA